MRSPDVLSKTLMPLNSPVRSIRQSYLTLTRWYDDEQVSERNEFINWDEGGLNCRVSLARSPWKKD